ncbi:hypothetical protein GQ42DRAFT_153589 [Ramicandelaber brevisporus]|nr:hypothetical protein GQ42DRAFT_153589 [Ramicandelaber brevisporus]
MYNRTDSDARLRPEQWPRTKRRRGAALVAVSPVFTALLTLTALIGGISVVCGQPSASDAHSPPTGTGPLLSSGGVVGTPSTDSRPSRGGGGGGGGGNGAFSPATTHSSATPAGSGWWPNAQSGGSWPSPTPWASGSTSVASASSSLFVKSSSGDIVPATPSTASATTTLSPIQVGMYVPDWSVKWYSVTTYSGSFDALIPWTPPQPSRIYPTTTSSASALSSYSGPGSVSVASSMQRMASASSSSPSSSYSPPSSSSSTSSLSPTPSPSSQSGRTPNTENSPDTEELTYSTGRVVPRQAQSEYPFVVSIVRRNLAGAPKDSWTRCMGALISNRHVLTTAKCALDLEWWVEPANKPAPDMRTSGVSYAEVGELAVMMVGEPEVKHRVSSIKVYGTKEPPPGFNATTAVTPVEPMGNIAVLELNQDIAFNYTAAPIEVCKSDVTNLTSLKLLTWRQRKWIDDAPAVVETDGFVATQVNLSDYCTCSKHIGGNLLPLQPFPQQMTGKPSDSNGDYFMGNIDTIPAAICAQVNSRSLCDISTGGLLIREETAVLRNGKPVITLLGMYTATYPFQRREDVCGISSAFDEKALSAAFINAQKYMPWLEVVTKESKSPPRNIPDTLKNKSKPRSSSSTSAGSVPSKPSSPEPQTVDIVFDSRHIVSNAESGDIPRRPHANGAVLSLSATSATSLLLMTLMATSFSTLCTTAHYLRSSRLR